MSHAESHCAECGAPPVDGLTCWEQLGLLIAWEATDPALRAEHFLIVAAYNLQHPAQFTAEALAGLRAAFIDYLDHGVSVAELRQRVAKAVSGSTRVLRKEADRHPVLRQWPITIAQVYLPDQPQGAAERVRAWAQAIRRTL